MLSKLIRLKYNTMKACENVEIRMKYNVLEGCENCQAYIISMHNVFIKMQFNLSKIR